MNNGDNQNPSPRGPEDERAGPSPSEEAGSAEEKPIVKKAPQTPDANSIDPRVGNR